jgi:hypothetical protein
MSKVLGLVCFLAILQGCSSGTLSSEPLNSPLNEIYAAVEASLTMGIQSYSENRREITTRPFIVNQSSEAKKHGQRERGRAKVTILGNERPYTVEVVVTIEVAEKGSENEYTTSRYDKGLANTLLRNILATIQKYGRDKNVIDDFRSF